MKLAVFAFLAVFFIGMGIALSSLPGTILVVAFLKGIFGA